MPYLPEALASLEAQSFRDFEVILWDNGSTDGGVEEAQRWIPTRLPGRVVTTCPLPLHECLARMVEESCTEFCARMDADDVCLPGRLQRQMDEFTSDVELAALGSQAEFVDAGGSRTGGHSEFPLEFCDILSGMLVENQLLHPSIMFRRQAVLDAGNYAIAKPCEDYDLWLRVALQGRLRNLSERLLLYRIHPNSILASARSARQLEEPNLRCIEAHSELIFGVPAMVYRQLRRKERLLSCLPLARAALRIACRADVSPLRVLRSPSFLWSARCLTCKSDLVSRAVWGAVQRLPLPGSP